MNLQHELRAEYGRLVTRRWFFRQCGVGLGSLALASLLEPQRARAAAGLGRLFRLREEELGEGESAHAAASADGSAVSWRNRSSRLACS